MPRGHPSLRARRHHAGANLAIATTALSVLICSPTPAAPGFRPVAGERPGETRLAAACGDLRLTAVPGGIAFALGLTPPPPARWEDPRDQREEWQPRQLAGYVVLLEFVGADPGVQPTGDASHGPLLNVYRGQDHGRWLEGRSCTDEVVYRGLWPGVDLVLRPEGGRLAYEWRGSAQALARVSVLWQGATSIEQAGDDEIISTPRGELIVSPALGSARSGWISLAQEAGKATAPEPRVAAKDLDQLVWSTFLGGWSVEECYAVTSDGEGLTYLAGFTDSWDYPAMTGGIVANGWRNAMVTALDEENGFPVWSTVFGGVDLNYATGVAVLPNGNAVVVGSTWAPDFPWTPGVQDSTVAAGGASFIAELEAQTGRLVWCTFLDYGMPNCVAAASDGAVILAGIVFSSALPTTDGAFQTTYHGGTCDGFVARISGQGRSLDWCTYLGGSDSDDLFAIALDDQDRPVVGGSTGYAFPVTSGSYDTSYDGHACGFVTKLAADGRQLVWSTFFAAGIRALTLGGDGRVVMAGITGGDTFPVTADAYQKSLRGGEDGFVSTLSADGSSLLQSTYLGGPTYDRLEGVALPPGGGILVAGRTDGPTFPGPLGPDQFLVSGENAAILAHLDSAGKTLLGVGVYGGSDYLQRMRVTVTGSGAAIMTGSTWSADFPVTEGCFDDSLGGEDIFALRAESLVTPVWLRQFEASRSLTSALVRWRWEGSVGGGELGLWRQAGAGERELLARWAAGSALVLEYADARAPAGEVSYWLQLVAEDGQESWYGPAPLEAAAIPAALRLAPNRPNPFNPRTTIRYDLPRPTRVTLSVYDQRGRLVRTLVDETRVAGEWTVEWDGRDDRGRALASGTYVLRLATEQGTRTAKVTLAK